MLNKSDYSYDNMYSFIYLQSCEDFASSILLLAVLLSRVMHQNVQIWAKGHFLPGFVKHNSNNNNEVWFYKERGRLDMLVWFLANIRSLGQGLSTAGAQHRMDFGQMESLAKVEEISLVHSYQ